MMTRELALQILKAACDTEVKGDDHVVPIGVDLTLHIGRTSNAWSIQHVQRLQISADGIISGETRKGQRFGLLLEEFRGAIGEGSANEKSTRNKPGFM